MPGDDHIRGLPGGIWGNISGTIIFARKLFSMVRHGKIKVKDIGVLLFYNDIDVLDTIF